MSTLTSLLPWGVAAWLLVIGLYAIVTSRNYVHLIGCLSVVQSSTYVLLLATGYRQGAGPPVFYTHPPGTPAVDPVVQALVLTDIVIGATVSALLLSLALQLHKRRGKLDPEELRPMQK
jgi:multicomponent Na+:H+ antiporter subunit C